MTDQTEKPKLGTRPSLGIKRTVETGKVKQSFSHGRSNTVVVERKQRRIFTKPGEAPPPEAPKPEPVAEAPKPAPKPAAPQPAPRKPSPQDDITARKEMQVRLLREAEEARLASLEEARRREERALKDASEEERRRAEENRKAEEAAAEEARLKAEEDVKSAAEVPAEPETPGTNCRGTGGGAHGPPSGRARPCPAPAGARPPEPRPRRCRAPPRQAHRYARLVRRGR